MSDRSVAKEGEAGGPDIVGEAARPWQAAVAVAAVVKKSRMRARVRVRVTPLAQMWMVVSGSS